jgi:hypothetical protein
MRTTPWNALRTNKRFDRHIILVPQADEASTKSGSECVVVRRLTTRSSHLVYHLKYTHTGFSPEIKVNVLANSSYTVKFRQYY